MLSYPVRLAETGDGKVRAIFLDIPEAVAEAETELDALFQAKFVLEQSLGNYVLHDRPIPIPSDVPDAPLVSTDKFNLALPGTSTAASHAEAQAAPGGGRY